MNSIIEAQQEYLNCGGGIQMNPVQVTFSPQVAMERKLLKETAGQQNHIKVLSSFHRHHDVKKFWDKFFYYRGKKQKG